MRAPRTIAAMPDVNPRLLGNAERTVLEVVRRHGTVARSAIAAETRFTQPWVHRLTGSLVDAGWLVAGAPRRTGRGQPSPSLSISATAAYSVGLNVDTDSACVCLCDLSGRIVDRWALDAAPSDRAATLAAMREAFGKMAARHAVPHERVVGIGCAIAGYFTGPAGEVNAPDPLREWSLVDLAGLVERTFGLPVWVVNNATAGAVGEAMVGAGRWARSLCYLSFVYGFGSGIVIDGRQYLGRHGNAGEMRILRPGAEADDRPALRTLLETLRGRGVDVASVAELQRRYDPAWPGVADWLDRVQPQLDRIVNTLAGLFDPDAIVFGGLLPPALAETLISRTRFWGEWRYGSAPPLPRLVATEAGVDASVLGAALQPLLHHFFG